MRHGVSGSVSVARRANMGCEDELMVDVEVDVELGEAAQASRAGMRSCATSAAGTSRLDHAHLRLHCLILYRLPGVLAELRPLTYSCLRQITVMLESMR